MNDLADRIVSQHLADDLLARDWYRNDSTTHAMYDRARHAMSAAEKEMRHQGLTEDAILRVLRAFFTGCPDWPTPTPRTPTRDEARELLLTRFDPSASECTINQLFTEPGPGAAQLTDGTPEQLAAWLEKEQARLIESTGFDLRVPPEGDDGPVHPASSEETST